MMLLSARAETDLTLGCCNHVDGLLNRRGNFAVPRLANATAPVPVGPGK
jgi:hypothetical protein